MNTNDIKNLKDDEIYKIFGYNKGQITYLQYTDMIIKETIKELYNIDDIEPKSFSPKNKEYDISSAILFVLEKRLKKSRWIISGEMLPLLLEKTDKRIFGDFKFS